MILRSKWVVDRKLNIHANGIVDTGGPREELDLGEAILMPGLVNAHCHLEYTEMRWKIAPPRGFTQWIEQITAIKRSWNEADYVRSLDLGMREALEFGTTCMGNWICLPQLVSRIQLSPMRVWWFWEQIAFRANNELPDWDKWPEQVSKRSDYWVAALSPHAPYTCREEIVKKIREWSEQRALPWSIHVAESQDENAMFERGEGGLFELLKKSGRPMDDCHGMTPFQWLMPQLKAATSSVLLVHGNTLAQQDLDCLKKLSRRSKPWISIAYCPRSRRYFTHPEFPLQECVRRGIHVCLGTDSLASNSNLSLFEEMNLVAKLWAKGTDRDLVEMATIHGARALGVSQREWEAWQDWIAIPCKTSDRKIIWRAISHFTGKPFFVMINGQIIFKRDDLK